VVRIDFDVLEGDVFFKKDEEDPLHEGTELHFSAMRMKRPHLRIPSLNIASRALLSGALAPSFQPLPWHEGTALNRDGRDPF
jgi:hypothetical protein